MQDTSTLQRALWLCAIYPLLLLARGYALDPSRHISQYGHTLWRRQDTIVNATSPITQTTDGYIWITTANGLARFDGVNFIPWTPPRDIPFSWRHFTALLGAKDGSLWIGTSSGLGRLKEGHFRSYSKPGDRWGIGSIIQDHAGHIWVTRYDVPHGEGAICEASEDGLHCYGPADGVPLQYGLGLAEDTEGNFWIGSRYLCRWKPGSTCSIYFNKGPANTDIDTGTVASGPSQTVWAVVNTPGREGGLQRFSAGKWSSYSISGLSVSAGDSDAMLADSDGSLWIGTETDGLYRICNGVVDHYGPADGLSGHQVQQIYEDQEGNLWVTTDGGMDMFRNTPVFSYSVAEGLSSAYPRAILASQDGSIWITSSHGIDVLRDGHKQYLPAWPISLKETNSLLEDRTGTIWLSSGAGNDLVYWDHGSFHVLKPHNGDSHGQFVTGIAGDAQHSLWAVSQTYLFRIGQRQVQQYIPLPKNFVAPGLLASDLQGGVWISDRAAHLFRYSNGQFQTIELKDTGGPNAIQAMIADADDPLLVATASGLFRWDGQRWTVLDAHNGLPCARFASLVKDNYGALWLGAYCGLLRIDPSELAKWRLDAGAKVAPKVLDRLDGAHPGGKIMAEPYATKAPDGRIWFTDGFEVETFDPNHLFQNSVLPRVHIETVMADDKAFERSAALRLPARTRNLAIDYTALSLSVPQKVRFRYKLEGLDPSWREVINERKVQYSNLPPRHYRFRVIAANNSGVWNEEGDSLEFDILPAWYQTLWFRALCAIAFFLLLWSAYLLRVRHLRTQEKKLRDVIETMPTFAWTALPDGSEDFVNRHWNEYSGLSLKESAGSGWQAAVHPADLKLHLEKWRTSLATGEPFQNEVRYQRASDGQYRWFLSRAVPLRDGQGKIVRWYGISTDIEDRKGAEQEREQLRAELAHMNRVGVMGEIAASLAHEIRQPITAATTNAQICLWLLEREKLDVSEMREATSAVVQSVKRAGDIIERVRSLSKKSAQEHELVDVNQVVREIDAMLRNESWLSSVMTNLQLSESVPQVNGDRVQLQQVVMNLMLNAIEAMKDSGGELVVISEMTDSGQVLVSVSDTGVGLPEGKEEHIFDAFFTTKTQGTGMGLAISRSIIESHGGRLWAKRNVGDGSTFCFELPRYEPEAA